MDLVAYSAMPMDEQRRVLEKLQEIVATVPQFICTKAANQLIRLATAGRLAEFYQLRP